ncbi:MAG: hypothetical protein WA484_16810, partial [Solirubrobacteraceae bacterium]
MRDGENVAVAQLPCRRLAGESVGDCARRGVQGRSDQLGDIGTEGDLRQAGDAASAKTAHGSGCPRR